MPRYQRSQAESSTCSADEPLQGAPLDVDVVVIGAGIVGACVARAVRLRGFDVALVDPAPSQGASFGNAGMVVPSYCIPLSTPANLRAGVSALVRGNDAISLSRPLSRSTAGWLVRFALNCRTGRPARIAHDTYQLAARSRELYDEMQLDGLDVGLRPLGWLWAYRSASARRSAVALVRQLEEAGSTGQLLDLDQALAIEPGLAHDVTAAVWFPDEGSLDPARATEAIIDDARARGVIEVREKVVGADSDGRRTVSLNTASRTIRARWVVVATGAVSRAVGAMLGARINVEAGYGWSLSIPIDHEPILHPLMNVEDHVVITPLGGTIRLTGGMQFGGTANASPPAHATDQLRSAAARVVPAISDLAGGTIWRGARPMSSRGLPLLERCRGSDNVFIASGHGTLGMTLAPISGEIIAGLIAAQATGIAWRSH